jgi:hypothetical protein
VCGDTRGVRRTCRAVRAQPGLGQPFGADLDHPHQQSDRHRHPDRAARGGERPDQPGQPIHPALEQDEGADRGQQEKPIGIGGAT